jgi:hypothetical protein
MTQQLSWWSKGDNPNIHWAITHRGRYVIVRITVNDRPVWNVALNRVGAAQMGQQVGFAYSLAEAKQLAQRNHEADASAPVD